MGGDRALNEWVLLLKDFGFPVFMVIWFMFRTENVIKENTKVIQELKEVIEKNAS